MSRPKDGQTPQPRWKRLMLGVLWTLCVVATAWTLLASPPHLELWPTVALLTVVALGIAIPVSVERRHLRSSDPNEPKKDT